MQMLILWHQIIVIAVLFTYDTGLRYEMWLWFLCHVIDSYFRSFIFHVFDVYFMSLIVMSGESILAQICVWTIRATNDSKKPNLMEYLKAFRFFRYFSLGIILIHSFVDTQA